MLPAVISVDALQGHRLRVAFSDGLVCDVDLSRDLWGPMFEPLRDPAFFKQARIDEEGHTVVWPNGLDLDPLVLHGDYPPDPPARIEMTRRVT